MSRSILPIGHEKAIPIGNLPFSARSYDAYVAHPIADKDRSLHVKAYLDEIQARRCARLNQLVKDAGGQTLAIERIGKSQSQLSQLMSGKKPIGESLARDIEFAAKKPFGWLDTDEEQQSQQERGPKHPQDPIAKKLWSLWPNLDDDARMELVIAAANAYGELRRTHKKDAPENQRRA